MATDIQTKVYTSFKSLLSDKVIGKNDLLTIALDLLHEESGFNQRDYNDPDVVEQIERFAASFEAADYVPPMIVRFCIATQKVLIVEGHLRRRGALLAMQRGCKLERMLCVPFRGGDKDRIALMVNSAQGLPLKPLGIAMSYLKLLRLGSDTAEIARRVKRSLSHVEDMLVLATANTDVHSLVSACKVNQTNAIAAVKQHGDQAGTVLSQELEKALALGKSKITASALKPWMPSAKLMREIYASADPLISSLPTESATLVASVDLDNIAALKGKTMEVDAYAVARLFLAMKDATEAKERRSQRDSESKFKSKQCQIV